MIQNPWPYRVDGELGRVEFPTYRVCQHGTTLYDTAREVFSPLGCWERYETIGFKDIAFMYGVTEQSTRKTTELLNRIRHQADATAVTTLRTSAEREGQQVMACRDHTARAMLDREGFDELGQPRTHTPIWSQEAVEMSPERVKVSIDACELTADERTEVAHNPVLYEQPTETVNISGDDVVVKQQKEHRSGEEKDHERIENDQGQDKSTRHYVQNTVAHLHHDTHSYCITGHGVPMVLRILLGYLLTNALLGARLQFFVDGQKTLQSAIVRAFSWFTNLGMILDWYHLEDKCTRQLSSAMNGKAVRNDVLEKLTRELWYGRVESAIVYLRSLPDETMKDPDAIRVLIGYCHLN